MLNDSRKLIKSGKLLPKLFDKLYMSSNDNIDELSTKPPKGIISDLAYKILIELKDEDSKIIILNRDKINLDIDFTNEIKRPLIYFNITQESELYKNNINPHYWDISKKTGHWNLEAHKIIGKSLYDILDK